MKSKRKLLPWNKAIEDAKGPDPMLTKVESLLDEAMGNCLFMDDVTYKTFEIGDES